MLCKICGYRFPEEWHKVREFEDGYICKCICPICGQSYFEEYCH